MGGGGSSKIEETAEQRELAAIAAEQYEYYERELMPVRNAYISEMKAGNDESKFDRLASSVSTDTTAILDAEQEGGVKQMAAAGIDPSSGKFLATTGDMAKEAGRISADALNRGQVAQQDAHLKGLSNVIAMGEKKATQAVQGLSDVAANSADHARASAMDSLRKRDTAGTGLGLVAGVGFDMATSGKSNSGGG